MKKIKKIGIIGGMGPLASANYYKLLVQKAQSDYKAVQDTDFPEIILYSIGLEDFGEDAEVENDYIKNKLIKHAQELQNLGADCITIPCNTVHYFQDQIKSNIDIPLISILDETVNVVTKQGLNKVGILCSESTNKLKLYASKLQNKNIKTVSPDDNQQLILNNIILNVMGGTHGKKENTQINDIIEQFKKERIESVILGCTELPVAFSKNDSKLNVISTLEVLADAALNFAYNN